MTFGIELPSVTTEGGEKPSNKFDEQIQKWEVSHWQASFNKIFPANGFFPGCVINAVSVREGGIDHSKDFKLEPDFKRPNNKIKLGANNEKATYQINWFVQQENKQAVKELLDRGARVDGLSDVDESPLTFALKMLSALFPRSRDELFFRWVIERPEIYKVVNIATQKNKLLPIIQAVETGIPWVVERLIKLGAKPDKKGMSDNVTALRVSISLLGAP